MYVCICNAITEKMLAENHFLLEKVGSKCGKCLEGGTVKDNAQVTYLVKNEKDRRDSK